MAASRYNLSIHPKVRVGRLIGFAFITGYWQQDAQAIQFAQWIEPCLANYATISVSKVIREAGSNEIPAEHQIEDTEDVKLVLENADNSSLKNFLTLPGLKPGSDLSGITDGARCMSDAAGANFFNKLASKSVLGRNVIAGGPY